MEIDGKTQHSPDTMPGTASPALPRAVVSAQCSLPTRRTALLLRHQSGKRAAAAAAAASPQNRSPLIVLRAAVHCATLVLAACNAATAVDG